MDIVEPPDCTEVGEYEPFESPLVAQNLLEEKRIGSDGDAIDFVVSGHGSHRVALAESRFKSTQHHHAQFTFTHVNGRRVGATFGRSVSGEVLGLGNNGVIGIEALALRAAHVGETHLSCEVWIFAVVFFDSTPAWLAREVENGRKHHVNAGGAHLGGDGRTGSFNDLWIPCGGESDRRWEDGSLIETVQAL